MTKLSVRRWPLCPLLLLAVALPIINSTAALAECRMPHEGWSCMRGGYRVEVVTPYLSPVHVRLQPRLSSVLPPPSAHAPAAGSQWNDRGTWNGEALWPFGRAQYRAAHFGVTSLKIGVVGDFVRYDWSSGWRLSWFSGSAAVGAADLSDVVTGVYMFALGKQRSGVEALLGAAVPLTLQADLVRIRSPNRWELFVGSAIELRPLGGELLWQAPVVGVAKSWE